MKPKTFFTGYGIYIQIWLMIVAIGLNLEKDSPLRSIALNPWTNAIIFVVPFLFWLLIARYPSVAKVFRLLTFRFFRVRAFASVGLILILVYTLSFLYNLITFGFSGEQVFMNVLILDLVFLFFLSLILTGRFRVIEPTGLLIQRRGFGEVYLYKKGVLRHIPDPPTLVLLGYSFDDVQILSDKQFQAYTVRTALDSVATGMLIQATDRPEVHIVIDHEKRHIPNPDTLFYIQQLNAHQRGQRIIQRITQADLDRYETANPIKNILE